MSEPCILLVEDNADDAFLASRIVKKVCNERIVVVRDGEEALDLLAQMEQDGSHTLVRLVLLDLKLPKLSGLDVLKTIRRSPQLRDLPVVVLTSSDNDLDQERCRELGVIDYIFKPMTAERLQLALSEGERSRPAFSG
ncbi:response regulator [Geomonas sp. Red32]|uniref:response regulator n=1 Tax=Geomonas sp. Red32 TaxID=2912856 RepID=UPI00202CB9CD|nr:response regulator [Geomonas sp. Red32]MCM0081511.1 response regulator [Geomonas sp. Red32]